MTKNEVLREVGRLVSNGYYNFQGIRLTQNNQIRDLVRKRYEGIDFSEVEKKKPKKERFKKKFIDKEIPKYLKSLVKEEKLSGNEEEFILKAMELGKETEKTEAKYRNLMMSYVGSEPVFTEFLQHIKGISAVISANLIKEFGYCEKAKYISSLWKYSGLHTEDGMAVKREKGKKLDFDMRIRKFSYVIGDSFVKQRTPFYRKI